MSNPATQADKIKLQKKRQALSSRIEAHRTVVETHLASQKDEPPPPVEWEDLDDGDYDDIAYVDVDGYEEGRAAFAATTTPTPTVTTMTNPSSARSKSKKPPQPETLPITLPSTLGIAECERVGIASLIPLEIKLRIGQCNDHLQKCRLSIAHKSYIYRTGTRHGDSVRETGRSWAEMHALEVSLAQHARCYTSARRSLQKLKADDEVLAKYQPLTRADLKANAAVVNPNIRGERDKDLPWIWTVNLEGKEEDPEWLNDCKYWWR